MHCLSKLDFQKYKYLFERKPSNKSSVICLLPFEGEVFFLREEVYNKANLPNVSFSHGLRKRMRPSLRSRLSQQRTRQPKQRKK